MFRRSKTGAGIGVAVASAAHLQPSHGGAGDRPQPGPLDRAHRSGRATGDYQDPPTTLLLPRRAAHPLGAPPHFASSPALALGKPVQSRPGTIASPSISGLTAATSPLTPIRPTEHPRQLAPIQSAKGTPCPLPIELCPHSHGGPPSSCLGAYLTPPSSPFIGIGLGPFAFPYPSSLVLSTPAPIASVDSG